MSFGVRCKLSRVLLMVLTFGALGGVGVHAARGQAPPSQEVRLDLSTEDGAPCSHIDDTRTAKVGEVFQVAVCLLNAPEPPAVVTFSVLYDDRVVLAPNVGACDAVFGKADDIFATPVPGSVASVEEALDCNPDANAGTTIFGDVGLGGGWDCTSGGVIEPWGNRPPPTGNAFNGGCISATGPYTLPPNAPVAMITFRAEAAGGTALTPVLVSITGASGVGTGTCGPVVDVEMRCTGGLIRVGEDPQAGAPNAGADANGDSGIPVARIAIGAGFALLFVAGAAVWLRGRWRRAAG